LKPISYARHQFPPSVIKQAIRLYLRFTLSYRDVEELLAERDLEVSYETIRRWVCKFGPAIARRLRRPRPRSSPRGHLDEMVLQRHLSSQPTLRRFRAVAFDAWTPRPQLRDKARRGILVAS
jgi:hypothetical protein